MFWLKFRKKNLDGDKMIDLFHQIGHECIKMQIFFSSLYCQIVFPLKRSIQMRIYCFFLSIEPSFWFVHLFSVVVPSYNEMRFFLLFGGAGAILISLVLCWAVEARVTRARPLFEETGVAISNFFDSVAGHGGVVVVVGIRSNSAIASWIAFSNCEFNFRPLQ